MRRFYLQRDEDATGVSGVGRVADGVEFTNGWCAITWKSEFPGVSIYPSISVLENIHTHYGQHRTVLVWIDPKFENVEERSAKTKKHEKETTGTEKTKVLIPIKKKKKKQ